jgi:hypothetical protein
MEFHSKIGGKKVHDSDNQIQQFSIKKLSVKSHMMLKVRLIYNQWSFGFCPIFDRYSFNSDDYSILKSFLSNTLQIDSELAYYSLKTSCIDCGIWYKIYLRTNFVPN